MDTENDKDFVEELRNSALRTGRSHIETARLVTITENADALLSEAERVHLATCHACREDLDHLRDLPDLGVIEDELGLPASGSIPPEAAAPPVPQDQVLHGSQTRGGQVSSSPATSRFRWLFGVGGLAVAAVLAGVLILRQPESTVENGAPEIVALAQLRPIPLRVPRSGIGEDPFSQALFGGLEAYVASDFHTAATKLAEATDLQPDNSEAWVFRGSAELLAQRTDMAITSLRTSVVKAAAPDHKHEACWQLANAYLAKGDAASARPLLQTCAGEDGPRKGAAAQMLQSLDALQR